MYLRYLKIFPTNPEKASFYSRFIWAQSHFKSYPYPSFSSEPLAPQKRVTTSRSWNILLWNWTILQDPPTSSVSLRPTWQLPLWWFLLSHNAICHLSDLDRMLAMLSNMPSNTRSTASLAGLFGHGIVLHFSLKTGITKINTYKALHMGNETVERNFFPTRSTT